MTTGKNDRSAIRLLAIGLIIGLGAYWLGSRYGKPSPRSVDALRLNAAPSDNTLDAFEAENVRIYRQASPAVANVVTRTVEYDFFFNPVPVEGAGSGFVIDTEGHILTNYHVIQGAQTIEVTLGDRSRFKAKLIGVDTRNDLALIKIDPAGRKLTTLPARRFAQSPRRPARPRHRQSLRLSKHAHHRRGQLARPHGPNRRKHFH